MTTSDEYIDLINRLRVLTERLGENEILFRYAMNHIPGTLWTTDTDLVFTSSMGAGLAKMGLEVGEVIGQSLYDFFGGSDRNEIKYHKEALSGSSVEYDSTWKGIIWKTFLDPFLDNDGRIIGVIGIAFDVTQERMQSEKLQAVFDQSPLGLQIFDSELCLVDINREALKIIGIDEESKIIGKHIKEIIDLSPQDLKRLTTESKLEREDRISFSKRGLVKARIIGKKIQTILSDRQYLIIVRELL